MIRQAELDSQVAKATGESINEIRHRGFNEIHSLDEFYQRHWDDLNDAPPQPPQTVDWDELERERCVAVYSPARCPW